MSFFEYIVCKGSQSEFAKVIKKKSFVIQTHQDIINVSKNFEQNFGQNFQLFAEYVDTTDTLYQGVVYSKQYQKKVNEN